MIKRERGLKAEFDKKVKVLKLDEQAKKELFNRFSEIHNNGFKCAYCDVGMELKWGDTELAFTIDHVLARVRGGSNDIRNLAFCCQSCNSMKGDKDVEWFVRNVKKLKSRKNKRESWKARKSSKRDEAIRETYKAIFKMRDIKND